MIDIEVVKSRAKLLRMPLSELAEKIGYSEPGMYRAFAHKKFNVRAIMSISQVLGLEISQFVTDPETIESLAPMTSKLITNHDVNPLSGKDHIYEAYLDRIKTLQMTVNSFHEQMEIKDQQIRYKDEQIMIFLKALNRKDDMIEQFQEEARVRNEGLKAIVEFLNKAGIKAEISATEGIDIKDEGVQTDIEVRQKKKEK